MPTKPQLALKAHVEKLLSDAGYNPTSVAVAAGLNMHYVRQWLSGRVRNPGAAHLKKVADVLGITLDELTTPPSDSAQPGAREPFGQAGFDANYPADALRKPLKTGPLLPVRFVVQAGSWLEVDGMAQARIPSPPVAADSNFPRDLQWLELVRGDSADLFYPEGIFVHVVDAVGIGYAPRHDDFVVVERKRDQGGFIERSLKQVARSGRKIELWPRSRNPKWKAPLDLNDSRDDDTEIAIAALVLGGYLPARRS